MAHTLQAHPGSTIQHCDGPDGLFQPNEFGWFHVEDEHIARQLVAAGSAIGIPRFPVCPTEGRPTEGIHAGSAVFDSTLGCLAIFDGTKWLDATGTTI